jgi:hypothetical protein
LKDTDGAAGSDLQVAIRAWANQDPQAAAMQERVDARRAPGERPQPTQSISAPCLTRNVESRALIHEEGRMGGYPGVLMDERL